MARTLGMTSFALFGLMLGTVVHGSPVWIGALVAGGALFGRIAAGLIGLSLRIGYGALRKSDPQALAASVSDGMLALLPFTTLALLAQFWLGWNVSQVFASSSLMASAAGAGAAAGRRAQGGRLGALAPIAGGILLSAGWILLCGLSARASGGR